jgi:4-diphosphocytidyl-2-C-methyl-D-erythritol kinase
MTRSPRLTERAPAKVNLTLRVLGRRIDGYHTLESLVAFAKLADGLTFVPGGPLALTVAGPTASAAGAGANNLVLKAAQALAGAVPGLKLGRFGLTKHLPVAAGLGGGSSDAAAALRLLARANGLRLDDPWLFKAARKVGADVPVCIDPHPRIMRGIGERLSNPIALAPLPAVLVNPGVALATQDVFAAWRRVETGRPAADRTPVPRDRDALLEYLQVRPNELEPAAIRVESSIARVLAALRASPGCRLARMSGSGATCFGVFPSARAAAAAARKLAAAHPRWWVRATVLG